MKIKKIGASTIVMSNPYGKANYFGWPSVTKLQNGKIAVVASGYRYGHICPFGKAVISYSENEGETYTAPAPVIDTPLDDRDAGILAYGNSNVLVTSFNNAVEFQRKSVGWLPSDENSQKISAFFEKSIDIITKEEEYRYLGSEFRISNDYGITFGDIHKSPITSPHGPCMLSDGSILWVGRTFDKMDNSGNLNDEIQAHKINADGSMEYLGSIANVKINGLKTLSCEPYAIQLKNGDIICHIRVQSHITSHGNNFFTVFQSESKDGGRNWSAPHQILEDKGGAPAHLLLHSSGMLISTYGYREEPYGIKAMFSKDNGKTWHTGYDIYINGINGDLGYPCSIELKDGSLLTVFYAHKHNDEPAVIMQQKWSFEDEI